MPEGRDDETHDDSAELTVDEENPPVNDEEINDEGGVTGSDGTSGNSEESYDDDEETASSVYDNEYSFDDNSQVAAEESDLESDLESDEEMGLLSRRLQGVGLSEEDRKVARALEKTLGLAAHDADIADSVMRLVDSGVLSSELFQSEMSDDDDVYRLYGAETRSNDGTEDGDAADDEEEEDEMKDGYIDTEDAEEEDEHDVHTAPEQSIDSGDGTRCEEPTEKKFSPVPCLDSVKDAPTNYGSVNKSLESVDGTRDEKSPEKASPAEPTRNRDEVETAPVGKEETLVEANLSPPRAQSRSGNGASAAQIRTTSMEDETSQAERQQSRNSSEGGFWAFEENTPTPVRETYNPAPLPTPNESTPLLSRKTPEPVPTPGSPASLKPSIFTTVAALAEESDEEEKRQQTGSSQSPKKEDS